jgi:hypothetical protein
MVERSRSGAYIPVGKMQISQLEATSPWLFAEKAKRLHAEDVCPDCAVEQGMKKLESAKARDGVLQAASRFHGSPQQPSPPGPNELPATVSGSKVVPVLDESKNLESAKARDDILQAASHFHGSPQPQPLDPNQLPTTAAGSKPVPTLDVFNDSGLTVVVQHEGIIDRLVIDPRRPMTRASTQRLSENLTKMSKAVAQLGSVDEHPVGTNADTDHPQTNKPEPQPLRPLKIKSCSMSELLDDLHAIAAGMNLDISDPTKRETLAQQAPSNITPIHPLYNSYDADKLLSEPTTPGPAPTDPSHTAESHEEPHYTRGLTPGQSLLHGEDPESLLSEPTSPGPMGDTALGEAIAAHQRSQALPDKTHSPPSVYATALPTRNNSIQGPIHLPSSILRATDYSPITTNPPTQRPFSRTVASPLVRTMSRFAPGHYPSTPTLPSPWSVQSPKTIKRVRVVDCWPPLENETTTSPGSPTSEPDSANIATELQKAVQEVAAREKELHRAVRQAAEMERVLRRRVRTRGGLGGEAGGAK